MHRGVVPASVVALMCLLGSTDWQALDRAWITTRQISRRQILPANETSRQGVDSHLPAQICTGTVEVRMVKEGRGGRLVAVVRPVNMLFENGVGESWLRGPVSGGGRRSKPA